MFFENFFEKDSQDVQQEHALSDDEESEEEEEQIDKNEDFKDFFDSFHKQIPFYACSNNVTYESFLMSTLFSMIDNNDDKNICF